MNLKVTLVSGEALAGPLGLLEAYLRDGNPLPEGFVRKMDAEISTGNLEVLAAWDTNNLSGRPVGVVVVSYRLNVSAGDEFASIEDLYVTPAARRTGTGRALLEAVEKGCSGRDISYVEVQIEDEEAHNFYTAVGFEGEEGVAVLSRSYALGGSYSETSNSETS